MKVRKFLFAGALIAASLFSVNSVMAETGPGKTDNVTVNIKFTPIQTIVVNASQKTVEFAYNSINDYNNGAGEITNKDHLTINSSGPFEVKVTGADFTGGIASKTIAANEIAVLVEKGTNNNISTYGTFSLLALATTSQVLINSATEGGMGLNFNVTYSNPGGANGNYFKGYVDGAEKTYTANVEYAIIAK